MQAESAVAIPAVMANDSANATGADGSPRIRLIVDTDEIVRRAVNRLARKRSLAEDREVTNSEVVTEILRDGLADEIAELERMDRKGKGRKS